MAENARTASGALSSTSPKRQRGFGPTLAGASGWSGNVLVTGGFNNSGFAIPHVEIFCTGGTETEGCDLPANLSAFIDSPNMTFSRAEHTATRLANGDVLIAGGSTANKPPTNFLGAAEIFVNGQGLSATIFPMKDVRAQHSATLLSTGAVVLDEVTHEHDVRAALDRPGARDATGMDVAFGFLCENFPSALRGAGAPKG